MARKRQRRNEWRKDKTGRWTRSLGERGHRVRLFQKRRDGPFYREVWIPAHGRSQACLQTSDRDRAYRMGTELYAALLTESYRTPAAESAPLALGSLWQAYRTSCEDFLDNKKKTQQDAAARAQILLAFFGAEFPVQDFSQDRQREYEQARRKGGIVMISGGRSRPVRDRSVEADMVLLHALLKWAAMIRVPGGGYMLDRNPLDGVKCVREKNKKQPVATWERYTATVEAMQRLAAAETGSRGRDRWLRMEFALFLAEATGRRLGSIRQLEWSDFQLETGLLHWSADADKRGYSWDVPMPPTFMDRVREFRRKLSAVGGPVFPAVKSDRAIMDRHLFDKWLARAEREAGLPKLDGGLWHAYRRKWAIERKHLPPMDVAAAGGWKGVQTLMQVYQQADPKSVLVVTSEVRKLRDRGVA
jgi:integrase